jgi:hypothetical protein
METEYFGGMYFHTISAKGVTRGVVYYEKESMSYDLGEIMANQPV